MGCVSPPTLIFMAVLLLPIHLTIIPLCNVLITSHNSKFLTTSRSDTSDSSAPIEAEKTLLSMLQKKKSLISSNYCPLFFNDTQISLVFSQHSLCCLYIPFPFHSGKWESFPVLPSFRIATTNNNGHDISPLLELAYLAWEKYQASLSPVVVTFIHPSNNKHIQIMHWQKAGTRTLYTPYKNKEHTHTHTYTKPTGKKSLNPNQGPVRLIFLIHILHAVSYCIVFTF